MFESAVIALDAVVLWLTTTTSDGGATGAFGSSTASVTGAPGAVSTLSPSPVTRRPNARRSRGHRLSTCQPRDVHAALRARRVKNGKVHATEVATCSSVSSRDVAFRSVLVEQEVRSLFTVQNSARMVLCSRSTCPVVRCASLLLGTRGRNSPSQVDPG